MAKSFQPTFWATACVIPVLIVLVALGTWQVQRLEWKSQLIDNRAARITKPPVPLAVLADVQGGQLDETALKLLEYMPVDLRGRFVGGDSLRLLPRVRDGKQGLHLIAPFDAGNPLGTVLIDRGWVPLDIPLEATRPPFGPFRIRGFVRLFVEPGPFIPANEPDANNWFFMHEGEMLAAAGLSRPAGFYVQAGPNTTPLGPFPKGSVPDINLRNPHLEYAVTWYVLAAVLLVIYVIFHWRRDET